MWKIKKISRLPKFATRTLVGVYLNGNNLKLIQINISLNKKEVVKLLSRNINGLSEEDIAKTLRGLIAELRIKSPSLVDIIPSHLVITKNIEIPSVDKKEINEIISLQAGRHTPYAREEIIVDFIEIGTYKNSYTKVLLVIVARSVIRRHFDIFNRAGVQSEKVLLGIEGTACSSEKIFKIDNEKVPICIINVDEAFSDFAVIVKNKLLFLRNIPLGAEHMLEGKEKCTIKFVEEVKKSLEAYQNEDIEKVPNLLILTGAMEVMSYFEAALKNYLHLPIKNISYFKNLMISDAIDQQASIFKQQSFLNIIAPMLNCEEVKVDLIPEEIKLSRVLQERGKELIKTGILIFTVFVLMFLIFLSHIYFKAAYLKKLDAKYQPLNQETKELEKDFTKISLIRNYLGSRGYSLEVLTEIYNLITPDLKLTNIRYDEDSRFSLRGTAESMSAVFTFVENMEKSKYFKEVRTRYTTKRKEGTQDVTDFEIVSRLEKNIAN